MIRIKNVSTLLGIFAMIISVISGCGLVKGNKAEQKYIEEKIEQTYVAERIEPKYIRMSIDRNIANGGKGRESILKEEIEKYQEKNKEEIESRVKEVIETYKEEKEELMRTVNLIGLGDSVMEGATNEKVGVLDTIQNNYGSNILIDTSIGGSIIGDYDTEIPTCYRQYKEIERYIAEKGYAGKTCIVMDGGANDCVCGLTEGEICYYTEELVKKIQTITNKELPIIYVIPKTNNEIFSYFAADAQIECLKGLGDNIYIIDERELLDWEDMNDYVHINQNGYDKIAKEASKIIYSFYKG